MIETPVLICGGGPVGLALSIHLSRLGIRSMVVNDRTKTTSHPRLDVVNCRSMEIFRQLGLSEQIRANGNPVSANQFSAVGASVSGPFYTVMSDRHIIYQPVQEANARIRACKDGSLPLESMQRISQMYLEPVLYQHACEDANVDVKFGHFLFGFERDDEGVTALIRKPGTDECFHVRSSYLVGCDGPHSRVRNFLNIDYDGTRDLIGELFIIHFRSKEAASLFPNGEPFWHTTISRPGFFGLLVSPDASRDDFVLHRPFPPRPEQRLEDLIDAALGAKVAYEIVQSGPWRPQFLVSNEIGRGRVFLAGDATHLYMPTGGLGLNTGLCESHNIAWKLAACLKGWGGSRLLETYQEERLPIARRNRDHVMKCAAGLFEFQFGVSPQVLAEGPAGDAARAEAGRLYEAKVSRMYESLGIEIGYRYSSSAIFRDENTGAPYEEIVYHPAPVCGARLPSIFREDGTALLDQVCLDGFTLLALGGDANGADSMLEAARNASVPLSVLHIREPAICRLLEQRYILVRPDQHICWRGSEIPQDCARILNVVRGAQ